MDPVRSAWIRCMCVCVVPRPAVTFYHDPHVLGFGQVVVSDIGLVEWAGRTQGNVTS